MEHAWPFVLLAFAYGCCVGSFLNVVIFRLSPLAPQPEPGRLQTAFTKWFPLLGSMWWDLRLLSNPPSHCPKCDHKLRPWDNIPVFAWLWLRGKCRDCKQPISIQYPIIEAICGLIFVALFFVDYQTTLRPSMGTLQESWPMLLVQFVLLGALLGATGIDARFYIIPHVIPYSSFFFTIIFLPWAVYQGWIVPMIDRVPTAGQWIHLPYVSEFPWETGFGYGGAIGLVIAILLLKTKLLPMSFADTPAPGSEAPGSEASASEATPATNHGEADVPVSPSSETKAAAPANTHVTQPQEEDPTDPETWYVHPHLRREMLKELLFLLFPTIGAIVGVKLWGNLEVEVWVSVLGSILTGALIGAGLVWYIRVLGSLAFGKEAMGLGDVHLMLAIGAVLGWMDVTVCFFVAPFSGILAAVLLPLASKFTKKVPAVLPYGPHLAVAAFAMLLFRVPILTLLGMLPR